MSDTLEPFTQEENIARTIMLHLLKEDAPEHTHMSLLMEMDDEEIRECALPQGFYSALLSLSQNEVVVIEGQNVTLGPAAKYLDSVGLVSL
jgi:hypothetical protein